MKIAPFCLLLFYASSTSMAQSAPVEDKAIALKRVIELNHYSPRPVNDSFSKFVFNTLIDAVDARRLFFTAAEYQQLADYRFKLDDELNGGRQSFLRQLSAIYKKALGRADSLINQLTNKPFNLGLAESLTFSPGKIVNFAAGLPELGNRWGRYLKFRACEQLYYATRSDSSRAINKQEALAKFEPVIRGKIKQAETRYISRILNNKAGYDNFLEELYLNTIAAAFDPHSNYFSQEGKEAFQSGISSEEFSFGLELEENQKGQFIIDHLQPGGPAWKSAELHKGDEIISLQQEGEPPFILSGETIEEVYEMLFKPTHGKLSFRIRKAGGIEETIVLRKEKINNEENVVRSFILDGSRKIGYILLPGFYTEWENENGSSCAGDVAKEIIKLKKENIQGLILDVRYNGGGSIDEALEMAGVFIDEGPLAGEKEKSGKLIFLKDPNRGMIYAGPMVLLVNGQSASASEMLAASLQDYNRAVIVGGNTFGKATIQQIFTLDTMAKGPAATNNGNDILKITVAKLYRLNGQSAQLNGVVPDILLPDELDDLDATEKNYPNALPSDTARKNSYYKQLPALPIQALAQKSEQRVKANKEFQAVEKSIAVRQSQAKSQQDEIIPLKWESFEKWAREHETVQPGTRNTATASLFKVDNNSQAKQWLAANEDAREWNSVLENNINKDSCLQEAFSVICDLISLLHPN